MDLFGYSPRDIDIARGIRSLGRAMRRNTLQYFQIGYSNR